MDILPYVISLPLIIWLIQPVFFLFIEDLLSVLRAATPRNWCLRPAAAPEARAHEARLDGEIAYNGNLANPRQSSRYLARIAWDFLSLRGSTFPDGGIALQGKSEEHHTPFEVWCTVFSDLDLDPLQHSDIRPRPRPMAALRKPHHNVKPILSADSRFSRLLGVHVFGAMFVPLLAPNLVVALHATGGSTPRRPTPVPGPRTTSKSTENIPLGRTHATTEGISVMLMAMTCTQLDYENGTAERNTDSYIRALLPEGLPGREYGDVSSSMQRRPSPVPAIDVNLVRNTRARMATSTQVRGRRGHCEPQREQGGESWATVRLSAERLRSPLY
ncbi:hypothetical protein V8D89_004379 [Ganoderma adspersum]